MVFGAGWGWTGIVEGDAAGLGGGKGGAVFVIGLDLGQKRDHSAAVVVEKPVPLLPFLRPEDRVLTVRAAERIPLGTPYPEIVEMMRHVVNLPALQGQTCVLAVDATGVGRPVVEMLQRANLGRQITAVTITSGDRQSSRSGEGDSMNVPKRDLISGLLVALEKGELRISKNINEAGTLVRELMDVRMSGGESGKMSFGAERSGQHDDLVCALALAVWRARRR